ncbi:TIGR03089 family protein [Mariniluteicoccus flavus]
MTLLPDLLADRVRRDPASPFLTHYGSPTERTELSARTFSNWADKTANLLVDEADLGPGDRVRLDLLATHPAHWMTLVWVAGVWRAGLAVVDGDADLVVTGPDAGGGPGSYACSLHPLALGLRDLPAGVRDFSADALAQPDAWFGEGPEADALAWSVGGVDLTHADVSAGEGRGSRAVVVSEGDALAAVRAALVAPLLGGGSSVVVAPTIDADARARLEEAEL